ncbi:MAG: hypothetical protein V1821_03295 [bacterium]
MSNSNSAPNPDAAKAAAADAKKAAQQKQQVLDVAKVVQNLLLDYFNKEAANNEELQKSPRLQALRERLKGAENDRDIRALLITQGPDFPEQVQKLLDRVLDKFPNKDQIKEAARIRYEQLFKAPESIAKAFAALQGEEPAPEPGEMDFSYRPAKKPRVPSPDLEELSFKPETPAPEVQPPALPEEPDLEIDVADILEEKPNLPSFEEAYLKHQQEVFKSLLGGEVPQNLSPAETNQLEIIYQIKQQFYELAQEGRDKPEIAEQLDALKKRLLEAAKELAAISPKLAVTLENRPAFLGIIRPPERINWAYDELSQSKQELALADEALAKLEPQADPKTRQAALKRQTRARNLLRHSVELLANNNDILALQPGTLIQSEDWYREAVGEIPLSHQEQLANKINTLNMWIRESEAYPNGEPVPLSENMGFFWNPEKIMNGLLDNKVVAQDEVKRIMEICLDKGASRTDRARIRTELLDRLAYNKRQQYDPNIRQAAYDYLKKRERELSKKLQKIQGNSQ